MIVDVDFDKSNQEIVVDFGVKYQGNAGSNDLSNYYTKNEVDQKIDEAVGEVNLGGAVLYTKQTLTEEQKAQARQNIGAVSEDVIGDINTVLASVVKGGVS